MQEPFERWAGLYDAVYAARGRDVAAQVRTIEGIAREAGIESGSLLDVGCGTGAHLALLSERFACTGLDASGAMLEVARRAAPRARFVEGDMLDAGAVDGTFDVVMSLFGVVNYVEDVERAVELMCARQAGVVIVEPAVLAEDLAPAQTSEMAVEVEGARVWRRTSAELSGERLDVRFEYEIERGSGVETFEEVHRISVRPAAAFGAVFEKAGLAWELRRPDGFPRGLLVAQGALRSL